MCCQYDQKGGEYSYADGVVQSEECSSKCIADNWQKHCNCFSKLYSVKHRRKGPICEYIDHLRCTDKMKKQLWLHSCQSACTRPCREVRYRGLVFRTGLLPQASASDNRSHVLVTVVMGSNKKKTIYTFPRLPLEDLAIYIGGHVDMWLGFALIGVFGVALDLAIRCSKWCHGNNTSVERMLEPPYKDAQDRLPSSSPTPSEQSSPAWGHSSSLFSRAQ